MGLVQLLYILVAVAVSNCNAKKWNATDSLTKFYCEADELNSVAQNETLNNHVRFLLSLHSLRASIVINGVRVSYRR